MRTLSDRWRLIGTRGASPETVRALADLLRPVIEQMREEARTHNTRPGLKTDGDGQIVHRLHVPQ